LKVRFAYTVKIEYHGAELELTVSTHGLEVTFTPDVSSWQLPQATLVRFKSKTNRYCILIPVIDEGERIAAQLVRMAPYCQNLDIVICDGGSSDDCTNPDRMNALGVTAVLYKKGPGKMSAQLRLLFAFALQEGYDGVIHMDGNNKDNPDALPRFVDHLSQSVDCVFSSRFKKGGASVNTPVERSLAIRWIHAPLISLSAHRWLQDTTISYRGYSRRLLEDPGIQPFRHVFDVYNLPYYLAVKACRLGFRVLEIPVKREYPPGEVPSKIKGLSGWLGIFKELLLTITGGFDP
jgi:dolichol-phosphate mannosyltransferase